MTQFSAINNDSITGYIDLDLFDGYPPGSTNMATSSWNIYF